MKTKHLFASVALASAFVACSQEELVNTNNEMQTLGDRPMVEAPVLNFGVSSRMTTDANGNFATVEWKEGDGFGAAVMDNYVAGGDSWATMFPIQNYINSNVLFSYNSAKGTFEADASMPMGNHLFYAPFNKANISRQPLAVAIPLTQVVSPVEGREVSNSVITSFYEDGTKPVFFAYDKVEDEAKTSLSLNLNHIFALPHVTLNLGEVRLSDAYNDKDNDNNKDEGENYTDVVSELTIKKIVFSSKQILTSGTISNQAVVDQLSKDEDGNYLWKTNQYEINTTASLLNIGTYNKTTNPFGQVSDKEISVEFEGGKTIKADENARFIMVLPGAEYTQAQLAVKVYATINGEDYALVNDFTTKTVTTIEPAREMRLLPGLPYAADEYNQDGNPKPSKGTSFSYEVEGRLAKLDPTVIDGYYEISNNADLIKYISEVAYRGKQLQEMSVDDAVNAIKNNTYDSKKNFVITATAEEPIVINSELVAAFNNSCVITNGNASLNFLGGSKNVVLGTMEYDMDEIPFDFTGVAYVSGDLSLAGANDTDFAAGLNLLSTASIDLTEDLTQVVTVNNENNATIELNSEAAHTINNVYGTLNVNTTTTATISNGDSTKPEAQKNNKNYFGVMTFADAVIASNATITNNAFGKATIEKATVKMVTNDGFVKMNVKAQSRLTVDGGEGRVDNTVNSKVTASGNVKVYAEIDTFEGVEDNYDSKSGLNTLVINGVLDNTPLPVITGITFKNLEFNAGSGIYFEEAGTLDLSSIEKIYINADVVFEGRDETITMVKVNANEPFVYGDKTTTTKYAITWIDMAKI